MTVAENISQIKNIKFDEVWELPLIEFFNFLSYLTHKNNEIETKYKKNGI